MNNSEKLELLIQNREQLDSSKNPVRYQLDLFFDEGSFVELGGFFSDQNESSAGVITGYGSINQRLVYAYAQDLYAMGGAFGKLQCEKICKLYDTALSTGAPIISIINSGGIRAEEGVAALVSFGKILEKIAQSKGIIPQITVIAGSCAGAQSLSSAGSDFTFMVEEGTEYSLNTPESVQLATGNVLDASCYSNASHSGIVDFLCADLTECARKVGELLNSLPMNYLDRPIDSQNDDDFNRLSSELDSIIPDDYKQEINVLGIIESIIDNGSLFQIGKDFAMNSIVGFAHLGGHSVGIVANNGEMDINACRKINRFVNICNQFNIPLISFIDAIGFNPSIDEEYNGVARTSAELAISYSLAKVPKISVILRKAYGCAYLVMGGKFTGVDIAFAWSTAEFALVSPDEAINKLYSHVIHAAANPDEARQKLQEEYRESFCSPYTGAENGQVDDIILPNTTRPRLISALEMLASKKG
ncbi:methylmalonyl-CoA carboxyltransferase [Clostridia bacterium]|nr:methylmalonyl-CoA carboxyltransferase [Clostridia bacterium]